MSSISASAQIATLVQAVEDGRTANSFSLICLTIVLHDIISQWPVERRLIWQAKTSPQKLLYIVLRYFVPIDLAIMLSVDTSSSIKWHYHLCHFISWYKAAGLWIPIYIAEGVMLLRVYALYGRTKTMLIFTCSLFIVRMAIGITLSGLEVSSGGISRAVYPAPPLPGCLATNPHNMYLNIVTTSINITTATILFSLTLYKFLSELWLDYNFRWQWSAFRDIKKSEPLLALLVRDGIFYFALVLGVEISFCVFMYQFKGRLLMNGGFPWMKLCYSIGGTRIALNLRATADKAAHPNLSDFLVPTMRTQTDPACSQDTGSDETACDDRCPCCVEADNKTEDFPYADAPAVGVNGDERHIV